MTDHEASQIIQNLVEIHRTIHWGNLSDTEHIPTLIFYYRSFSEYACDLDNYLSSTKGDNGRQDDLEKFESDVREGINGMIRFVGNYHTSINNKEIFITEIGIKEVLDILNIDVDEVLYSIRKIHNSNNIKESNSYSTYLEKLLKKPDFYGELSIQSIKNVKRIFEEDENCIFDMAIHLEIERLLKVRRKEKLKNIKRLVKNKIKR